MTRADEIAERLCDHKSWLTHGRSIKIDDLEAMGLRITNYAQDPELADAIRRYYSLMQVTLSSNIYKIFETPTSQIYKFMVVSGPTSATPPNAPKDAQCAFLDLECAKCKSKFKIQACLGVEQDLHDGCLPFPEVDHLNCPTCNADLDLSGARRQIELQSKKKIVKHRG